jgi:hypothetical protein
MLGSCSLIHRVDEPCHDTVKGLQFTAKTGFVGPLCGDREDLENENLLI